MAEGAQGAGGPGIPADAQVTEPLIVIGYNEEGQMCMNLFGPNPSNAIVIFERMKQVALGMLNFDRGRKVIGARGKLPPFPPDFGNRNGGG